jgi:DNA excision repair protein ERCC-5
MEGKALAIDSSIWIYQFQATMRDKEGKALVKRARVGFPAPDLQTPVLRNQAGVCVRWGRPCSEAKHYSTSLRNTTIFCRTHSPKSERRRKKSGAAVSHAKVAERLLAARLRQEALSHAQAQRCVR